MNTRLFRRLPGAARAVALCAATLTASSMSGCADDSGDGNGGAPAGAPGVIQDENNYTSQSNLTLPSIPVAAGQDVNICWDQIMQDMQCHALNPATDVDMVSLLRFDGWTKPQVAAALGIGGVGQSELALIADVKTDDVNTCTTLSTLTRFDSPLDLAADFAENPNSVYVMLFHRGTTLGVGATTMVFVDPLAAGTGLQVDAVNGCEILDFIADIVNVTPVPLPAAGPWTVDWSAVNTDSNGEPLPFTNIDRLLLGFYPGFTVQQLQDSILDLEQLASPMYEMPLTGLTRNADLAQAVDNVTGAPFTGFTNTNGVWALALMCSSCQNPAPAVLTIIAPN